MATAAIELVDVRAGYGRIEVLHGVTFSVPTGSVFALLGPNGAGKSTTLQVIAGKIRPTSGCVHLAGSHVNGAAPESLTKAGVCRIPEGRGIFPNLSVVENLRLWTYAAELPMREVEDRVYARFPRLGERRKQLAGTLSGGEQQMLAMGRAMMGEPKLLMLDEPSLGLAPIIVADIFRTVTELRASGVSVLLVEQNAQAALRIADRAYVMELGEFVLSGKAADIAADPRVAASYLGGFESKSA